MLEFEKTKSIEYLTMAKLNQINLEEYSNLREKLHHLVMREMGKFQKEMLDEQFVVARNSNSNILHTDIN